MFLPYSRKGLLDRQPGFHKEAPCMCCPSPENCPGFDRRPEKKTLTDFIVLQLFSKGGQPSVDYSIMTGCRSLFRVLQSNRKRMQAMHHFKFSSSCIFTKVKMNKWNYINIVTYLMVYMQRLSFHCIVKIKTIDMFYIMFSHEVFRQHSSRGYF